MTMAKEKGIVRNLREKQFKMKDKAQLVMVRVLNQYQPNNSRSSTMAPYLIFLEQMDWYQTNQSWKIKIYLNKTNSLYQKQLKSHRWPLSTIEKWTFSKMSTKERRNPPSTWMKITQSYSSLVNTFLKLYKSIKPKGYMTISKNW